MQFLEITLKMRFHFYIKNRNELRFLEACSKQQRTFESRLASIINQHWSIVKDKKIAPQKLERREFVE